METEVSQKIQVFFQNFPSRKLKKGQLIIDPNSIPSGLFYLQKGVVRQYTISPQGDDITINTFKSPSMFPVGWVINDTSNEYYFEAMGEVEIRIVSKNEALTFFKTNPDVVFDLMQRIYKGLDGYFKRMESFIAGSAKSRLIVHLLIHAKRFGEQGLEITERDLASQAGISRETVSRQIQLLKNKGLIKFERGILTIHSLRNLEKELEISAV